jgi:hypothetical protein
MKLIVTITLVFLSLGALNCQATANAFSSKWCGNSKVDVELTTGANGEIKTLASIVVPTTLSEVSEFNQAEKKLIQKTEQGLVLTLDGKANAAHLGSIYNYDEDDNTQIFIPYLYLSSVSENTNGMNVVMARTFKSLHADQKFNLVPVADAFGTALCQCQLQMLMDRIQQNLIKRHSVLAYVALQISEQMDQLSFVRGEIKKWTNAKADKSLLISLQKQAVSKELECKAFESQIKQLNSDIVDKETDLAQRKQDAARVQTDIENSEWFLGWWRGIENTNGINGDNALGMGTGSEEKDMLETKWRNAARGSAQSKMHIMFMSQDFAPQYPKSKAQFEEANKLDTDLSLAKSMTKMPTSQLAGILSGWKKIQQEYKTLKAEKI